MHHGGLRFGGFFTVLPAALSQLKATITYTTHPSLYRDIAGKVGWRIKGYGEARHN